MWRRRNRDGTLFEPDLRVGYLYSIVIRNSAVLSVRPKVAELAFHVFSRTLHPELYVVHKTRLISRSRYEARVDITNCGHVIKWTTRDLGSRDSCPQKEKDCSLNGAVAAGEPIDEIADCLPGDGFPGNADPTDAELSSPEICSGLSGDFTLCEVATSAHTPLPKRRCLFSKSLKGSRTEHASCRGGIEYRTHFQLESVEPDLFWMVGQQLEKGPTEGLLHHFDASGRMALGALSYISIETRQNSMRVQAIHTFPDDYAIVKVESLYSLPSA
tara:strand:+ start:28713 stop:29528 length:816 start_codon:yes stop_codon:yes gene_type:complete